MKFIWMRKFSRKWMSFPGLKGSVTAAPKSILPGYELGYGPLGVHRLCLGCFESDSKKKFFGP